MAEDVFRSLTFHAGCPKYVSPLVLFPAFPHLSQLVKNLPAVQETQVQSLSREDLLEKGMFSRGILAWRITWTEEPGGLQSVGSQRVKHD